MAEEHPVPPNPRALQEAFALSEDILQRIELSDMPLSRIALRCVRLARLLNDFEMQTLFEHEANGYPSSPAGCPPETYRLAVLAGREHKWKDEKSGAIKDSVYLESIGEIEHIEGSAESSLLAAQDRAVSVSSANPAQHVYAPMGNTLERNGIRVLAQRAAKRLSERRALIYRYTVRRNHELKFSGVASDIFSRVRERADRAIGSVVPDAINKLSAVYANLESENPEDWSNAVHSCRRVLQDLADAIYPARQDKTGEVDGKARTIKLGKDNYINRIIAFVQERTDSDRFREIVGSHLNYLGDRLDSVFQAAQKGSHDVILSRDEADRYVVYTYLLVGDVLSLTATESADFAPRLGAAHP